MRKDFTTAIVGAGALGAMYADAIARSGYPVYFAARGDRVRRLRENGVSVNGEHHHLPVIDVGADDFPAPDLVIVALKHHHLPDVCRWIRRLVSERTTVISVMNGIESEDSLIEALGEDSVLYAMAAGMDAVRIGSDVTYTVMGKVVFGRSVNDPDNPDPRVAVIQEFFDDVGITWQTPPDMVHALWNKFMLNVGINQFSVLLRAPYRMFHDDKRARDLMRLAMEEVLALAEAKGVALSRDDLERWFPVVKTLSPEGKTSMLQDIEAGRKTEVEMFAGRMVALGEELGVPTPVNRVLLLSIQALEAAGSGPIAGSGPAAAKNR